MNVVGKSLTVWFLAVMCMLTALLFGCLAAPCLAHAKTVSAGTWHSVSMDGTDERTVTYKAPARGYFRVEYKVVSSADVYTYGDGDIERYENTYSSVSCRLSNAGTVYHSNSLLKVGKKYSSQDFCFKKGTKLKIAIANEYGDDEIDEVLYRVVLKKPTYCEKEPNNTKKKAMKLKVGKTYAATLNGASDVDWYKFVVPKTGKVKIQIKATRADYKGASLWYAGGYRMENVGYGAGWKTVAKGTCKKGFVSGFAINSLYDGMTYKIRVQVS